MASDSGQTQGATKSLWQQDLNSLCAAQQQKIPASQKEERISGICNHPDETPDSQETRGEVAVKQGMAVVLKELQEALQLMLPRGQRETGKESTVTAL